MGSKDAREKRGSRRGGGREGRGLGGSSVGAYGVECAQEMKAGRYETGSNEKIH